MRFKDPVTNTFSNKLAIYRKPCHKSSYIHSLSSQPTSIKRAVIRNMFLRAYRYCDSLFLESEEQRIYDDFGRLGYSKSFITKAKVSARRGRDHEIKIRQGLAQPKPPRERAKFQLSLPFHNATRGFGYRFAQRGVDVVFSNKTSIKSYVAKNERRPLDGGAYIIPCEQASCEQVYIGQSKNTQQRLRDHAAAVRGRPCLQDYTTARHTDNQPGCKLDPNSAVVVYRSNCESHRLIIETSLITLCNTVDGNTVSSDKRNIGTLGPMILKAAPIKWRSLAEVQPRGLNPEWIPRRYKKFFSTNLDRGPLVPAISTSNRASPSQDTTNHGYNLRPRNR